MKTKTIKRAADESGIPETLVRAVIRQLGGRDSLEDIRNHGISGGFCGFTYYKDTVGFFKRNRRAIAGLVERLADDLGENPADMVAGFGCLAGHDVHRKPEHEKRRALGEYLPSVSRCLYGGSIGDDDTQAANALAWFAAEEVARAFENE